MVAICGQKFDTKHSKNQHAMSLSDKLIYQKGKKNNPKKPKNKTPHEPKAYITFNYRN